MLHGKKILVAVTGSIAAYKTAFFVRLLIREGAEVRVVMTSAAKDFISPLTLSTLSKNAVYSDYFREDTGEWHNHVELGLWADLMVIAPLSANTLAKIANGYCDNLLCAVYLSAKCPVMVAPAMDLDMYLHPSTVGNLEKVRSFGNWVIDAEEGELASGLHGKGRMAEPEHLLSRVITHFRQCECLKGKKVLITSGPTHEPLDPVRFIGNHSSGKMGAALAIQAVNRGADVVFVTGPSQHIPSHPQIQVFPVGTAKEMLSVSEEVFDEVDVAIFAAAVSDYRPATVEAQKMKKKDNEGMTISLEQNPDIAKTLGQRKRNQYTVGFALETQNEEKNAQAKLDKKNFDLIVLNSLNDKGAGFAHDTNKVSIFDRKGLVSSIPLMTKKEIAGEIFDAITDRMP